MSLLTTGQCAYMCEIPLRKRDGSIVAYTIVDDVDAAWVNQWQWRLSHGQRFGYARRTTMVKHKAVSVKLHRELLGLTSGDCLEVDHINRNRLDNRRANLRVVNHSQQMQNTPAWGSSSRFRGVVLHKGARKWMARVRSDGRLINGGCFTSEIDAAEVALLLRLEFLPYSFDGEAVVEKQRQQTSGQTKSPTGWRLTCIYP